jgi:hypothetical protein
MSAMSVRLKVYKVYTEATSFANGLDKRIQRSARTCVPYRILLRSMGNLIFECVKQSLC